MSDPAALTTVHARQTLVDGALRPATLRIADGRIDAVLPWEGPGAEAPARPGVLRVPDAHVLLPGVVDTHVHVNEPGRTSWEGFATATRAAALGGVTTIVDMPLNAIPPTTTVAHLRLKQRAAARAAGVDIGFWGGAVPGNLADLEPLWEAGVLGFKCFLSPSGVDEFPPLDDAGLLAALREVARLDALLIVHAEDPAVLAAAPARAGSSYRDFVRSRPPEAEVAAIVRVLDGARETGARVHLLHLSSARALEPIAAARAEGLAVSVETCPHYLTFEVDELPDGDAAYKCCPPIRDAGNREALWQGLAEGLIDCVVTDHSPATPEEKARGGGDLQQAWGGIAGLQVGFAATAAGARARGIAIERVSAWTSKHTARLVGLDRPGSDRTGGQRAPKGAIAPGAAADLLVYDPDRPVRVRAADLAHRHPISAFDGRAWQGDVVATVLAGRPIAGPGADGVHRAEGPPTGRLLSRNTVCADGNTDATTVS